MSTYEQEQRDFEAWRRRTSKHKNRDDAIAVDGFGADADYVDRTTRAMWLAWRARSSLPPSNEGVALEEAARSLETIAELAGRGEFLLEDSEVRAYAAIRAKVARAALAAAGAKPEPEGVAETLRGRLQKQCSDWGTYWRASDSHGVELTKPQAIELLEDALGVEVEIKDNGCDTCNGTGMIGGPSFYAPDEGGEPCPDCAPIPVPDSGRAEAIYNPYLGAPTADEIVPLLPQSYYMDPPDGGSVTLLEQLRRMAKDAARYRFARLGSMTAMAIETNGEILNAGHRYRPHELAMEWAEKIDAAIDAQAQPAQLNADDFECCGNPVVGAEYMGAREMVCCGNPEPKGVQPAEQVGEQLLDGLEKALRDDGYEFAHEGRAVCEWVEGVAKALTSPAQQPVSAEANLLSIYEQRAVLADLQGLDCLINYHDCEEAGADAQEPGWGAANARRALELLAIGRAIIEADPDLWHEEQKAPFKLRYGERAALPTQHPAITAGERGEILIAGQQAEKGGNHG